MKKVGLIFVAVLCAIGIIGGVSYTQIKNSTVEEPIVHNETSSRLEEDRQKIAQMEKEQEQRQKQSEYDEAYYTELKAQKEKAAEEARQQKQLQQASSSSTSSSSSSSSSSTSSYSSSSSSGSETTMTYILNTNTKRFHVSGCRSISQMKEKNKSSATTTRTQLMNQGYKPCGNCHP